MSSRHFRKMNKQSNLPPPPDDSDEDYQPLYAQRSGFSTYAGLEVSSPSGSERASERSEEEAQDNVNALPAATANKKKNFKKKGKGKGRFAAYRTDEVERSVKEVNAILGSPPLAPSAKEPVNQALEVLTIDPKHLNVANELRKIFGSEEESPSRRARAPNRALLLKRVLIHPNKDTPVYEFNNYGWSMMKYKEKDNCMYFVFNHGEEYQKMHRNFLLRLAVARGSGDIVMNFEEARQKMHVEALLEISDRLFRMEENGVANEIVENVVTFLQYVAHPLFILSQNNVRLHYKFLENRPFHVAMLKYIYLLSNKACHRTALEIAKIMLLTDPTDPLALLFLIDILALRCREHEWLIEAIKYFDRQREAGLLFNIKYSNSLAHFHVALKNKLDFAESDRLIREAILAFPQVFVKILECNHISNPELLGHEIFKPDPQTPWTMSASEVFMIYAKMTFPRWNEPVVMNWLLKNATELCQSYNTSQEVKETAKDWSISRHSLFQVWPKEYLRHLSVFSSMSKLIIDLPLTSALFNRPTCAWDPLFDKSVNRYAYSYKYEPPTAPNFAANGSPVYSTNSMNDYYRMISQIALQTGRYPFMYLTTDEARQLNNLQFGYPPPMGRSVLDNRGVYFLPPEMNDNPPRRMHPNGYAMYDQPSFVPGFNLSVADWCLEYVLPNWGRPYLIHNGRKPPTSSRDLVFDDNDDEFSNYDYADDKRNFERDDREMAAALATQGPDDIRMEMEMSDAIDAVCLDNRINNMFRPSNAN